MKELEGTIVVADGTKISYKADHDDKSHAIELTVEPLYKPALHITFDRMDVVNFSAVLYDFIKEIANKK